MEKERIIRKPNHLGLIIDGNGRWAKKRGLTRTCGHIEGFKTLQKILEECFYCYEIPIVSVYAFSKENWNRPKDEVDNLINLFRKYLKKSLQKKYTDVRFNILGDVDGLPKDIALSCKQLMEDTQYNKSKILNMAINYSGQEEICNAFNKMIKNGIKVADINQIENHLYTSGQPPLDFVIRTSGEQRISNFMLWQMAYAEFYFPSEEWPNFNKKQLYKALLEYQKRDRRFGTIKG